MYESTTRPVKLQLDRAGDAALIDAKWPRGRFVGATASLCVDSGFNLEMRGSVEAE